MKRLILLVEIVPILLMMGLCGTITPSDVSRLESLQGQFQKYSGTRLVFSPSELPGGQRSYYTAMPRLSDSQSVRAAEICLEEVAKYPPQYLGQVGLKAIGVFAACVGTTGDGFHPYIPSLGGFRYYGMWNGAGGIAAAYYSDEQLPLTFHHEIFHHIQATRHGVTDAEQYARGQDARYHAAITGEQPYPPPSLRRANLAALKQARQCRVLRGAVSQYAAKTDNEDQAETARYFMSALADALVQVAEEPSLPGSQRILHCLWLYRQAGSPGPSVEWFVDVALQRPQRSPLSSRPTGSAAEVQELLTQLRSFAYAGRSGWDGVVGREDEARASLARAARLAPPRLNAKEARDLVDFGVAITRQLLRCRMRVKEQGDFTYAIWGAEDQSGVNWTLRQDILTFGSDAQRLKQLADLAPGTDEKLLRAQLENLRLVARYYAYIKANWTVTTGTLQVFKSARDAVADSLPAGGKSWAAAIKNTELSELAKQISADGTLRLIEPPGQGGHASFPGHQRSNAYLEKVDRAIVAPDIRAAIRQVQPACVRLAHASGCCISPRGIILTAAHVAERLGQTTTVMLPDGRKYEATCTVIDSYFDLAVLEIEGVTELPFAPLAHGPAEVGTWICIIGQPGTVTPDGHPTGYEPFHVSTGHIRGFREKNRLGSQSLGGTKHDAWTYWGHSGAALFNEKGEIVAMHNSWDPATAMRHAVTYEAINNFLNKAGVDFVTAP